MEFFEQIKQEKINKLMRVGFTKEQSELLLELITNSSFSGGIF